MPRWTLPDAALTATEDVVFAEIPDGTGKRLTHAIAPRSFVNGTWQSTLVQWLGPVVIAEARAWLVERYTPMEQRPKATLRGRLEDRPWVSREGGSARTGWTIRGRVAEVRGGAWVRTMSIDAVMAAGLPPDHPLPPDEEALLIEAATALVPYACACGTGPKSPAEHGTINILAEVTEGARAGAVGRCALCGRAWTFSMAEPCVRASFDGVW